MKEKKLIALNPLDSFLMREAANFFFVYKNGLDVDLVFEKLKVVFHEMPELGGRIVEKNGLFYIDPDGCRIDFNVSNVNARVPEYGPSNAWVDEDLYINSINIESLVRGESPLFSVKISRFTCGAAILGVSFAHCLADAGGTFELIARWAAICRDDRVFVRMDSDRGDMVDQDEDVEDIEDDVFIEMDEKDFALFSDEFNRASAERKYKVYIIKKEKIEEISKERMQCKNDMDMRISTQDLLVAKIWKRVVSAQEDLTTCNLCSVFNFRGKSGLKVGLNYFPNAITIGDFSCDSQTVGELGAHDLAKKIREMLVFGTDSKKIKKEIVLMKGMQNKSSESHFMYKSVYKTLLDRGVIINNLCKFSIDNIDFGSGSPQWFGNLNSNAPRHVCIQSSFDDSGDLIVHVNLPGGEMEKFDQYGDDLFG